ncbi:unnamed protein product [Malus baccata var. baccata]
MTAVYFGYYTRLVTDLLSKEEDFPPFASQSSRSISKQIICSAKGASPDVDARNTPSKRLKKSSSFSSTSLPALSTTTNPESSRENGAEGHTTETARFVVGAEEPNHSGQVEETLQLEKLLDTVMSSCRSYPRNIFDHVVETILHRNAAYTSSDENRVDLERQCYYVEAVEKARKLAKYKYSGRSSLYQG